jgi:hypothetical protein
MLDDRGNQFFVSAGGILSVQIPTPFQIPTPLKAPAKKEKEDSYS